MDPRIYKKCMRCIQRHTGCDRRFPFCKSCKSASECVYWKKAGFQNQEEALRAYRASLLHETKQVPRRTSSIKPPKTSFKSESPQTQPITAVKDIEWLDGDISHSQKKCPSSITKLIGRHLVEFDQSIARRLWSTGKTCCMDRGREAVYVDPQTDQEVPVARYRYGGGHQFFVVWLPGEDPSDVLEPAICKFRVYNNDGPVMQDGTSWMPLMWRTWVPQGVKYKAARDIIRYTRSTAPNPKWTSSHTIPASSLDVVGLNLDTPRDKRRSSTKRRSSLLQNAGSKRARGDSDSENDHEEDDLDIPKRHKVYDAGHTWKEKPNMIQERGPGGRFSSRPSLSASVDEPPHPHATGSSTKITLPNPIPRTPSTSFVIREPTKKGPNLAVSFQDSSGEVRGTYPYDECDTAQKLFDVACVAQIAQIEHPATRLLKVQFDGGGEGRIRPDNEQDFQNIFEAELKKLVNGAGGELEYRVTISPYL